MLDVNKVMLVGTAKNVYEKETSTGPCIVFDVETVTFGASQQKFINTHHVIGFGNVANRMLDEVYEGSRVFIDGRLESKKDADGKWLAQVVVIGYSVEN